MTWEPISKFHYGMFCDMHGGVPEYIRHREPLGTDEIVEWAYLGETACIRAVVKLEAGIVQTTLYVRKDYE